MCKKYSTNKKYIALNSHLLLCVLMFVSMLCLAAASAADGDIGLTIGFSIFVVLSVFIFLISPVCFVFDKAEVVIVYCLGLKERIRWNQIRNIYALGSWVANGGALPRYVIEYPKAEKAPFFVCGEISKTHRTKKLLKLFYNGKII